MNQISYNDLPKIVSPNEPHMACLILLDVSGSMGENSGEGVRPIYALNETLNQFKEAKNKLQQKNLKHILKRLKLK